MSDNYSPQHYLCIQAALCGIRAAIVNRRTRCCSKKVCYCAYGFFLFCRQCATVYFSIQPGVDYWHSCFRTACANGYC